VANEVGRLAYMILSRMNKKQGKHNPEQQTAGDNPNKRFATLLFDLLFFFDSHIRFPLLKV
jgi:hypothetical protein